MSTIKTPTNNAALASALRAGAGVLQPNALSSKYPGYTLDSSTDRLKTVLARAADQLEAPRADRVSVARDLQSLRGLCREESFYFAKVTEAFPQWTPTLVMLGAAMDSAATALRA